MERSSQAIQDRIEFGEKTKDSEEAIRELMGTVVKLENDLVQNRQEIREMSAAEENEKKNIFKFRFMNVE
ncbi:unnamed protein product [Caenorhabditis nigoni]